MDLSIIIVSYKDKDKLDNCLNSIQTAFWGDLKYEVIIVNNYPQEDLGSLKEKFVDINIRLFTSSKNLGMGKGNNLGIKQSQGKFILILNPDTILKGRSIFDLLTYLKDNSQVGLIGPKLLYPDQSLQLSCARFPRFFTPLLRRTFLGRYFSKQNSNFMMADFDHQQIREVDWLMGSCLLFRKSYSLENNQVFSPCFDERYFMYFEDIDLARQFWTHNLSVVYNPKALVIHDHQRQSARYPWYVALFVDLMAWHHIISWFKYFIKWGLKNK